MYCSNSVSVLMHGLHEEVTVSMTAVAALSLTWLHLAGAWSSLQGGSRWWLAVGLAAAALVVCVTRVDGGRGRVVLAGKTGAALAFARRFWARCYFLRFPARTFFRWLAIWPALRRAVAAPCGLLVLMVLLDAKRAKPSRALRLKS